MLQELTVWVTPFTSLTSLDDAIAKVQDLASQYGYHGNLLLPLAYGNMPQSQCNQTLPADMLVSGPWDVAMIRADVENAGLGFGGWAVPLDPSCGPYHASFAPECGYIAMNFEGTQDFWDAGDNADAIDAYWGSFWNALGADQDTMNGNVAATMVPTAGEQLNWSEAGLKALAGGCNILLLEVYGGPNTPAYKYPNDWPGPAFKAVTADDLGTPLAPILEIENLSAQFSQAAKLGHGNVHCWAI